MNTYLIVLGLAAVFVAVNGSSIAALKRDDSKSSEESSEELSEDVSLIEIIITLTKDLTVMVNSIGELKGAVKNNGGFDEIEAFFSKMELKFANFFFNRLAGPQRQPAGGQVPESSSPPPAVRQVASSQSLRSLKQLLAELKKLSKK